MSAGRTIEESKERYTVEEIKAMSFDFFTAMCDDEDCPYSYADIRAFQKGANLFLNYVAGVEQS